MKATTMMMMMINSKTLRLRRLLVGVRAHASRHRRTGIDQQHSVLLHSHRLLRKQARRLTQLLLNDNSEGLRRTSTKFLLQHRPQYAQDSRWQPRKETLLWQLTRPSP